MDAWDFPIKFLKGVGPKLAELLGKDGIKSLWDLLLTLPRTYEDRRHFHSLSEMRAAVGTNNTVLGRATILKYSPKQAGPRGRRWLEANAMLDASATLSLADSEPILFTWFHDPGGTTAHRFPPGTSVIFRAKLQFFKGMLQAVHPEFQKSEQELPPWEFGGFVPVYREIMGISTRVLRKIVYGALDREEFRSLPEALPAELSARLSLPSFQQSVRELHFPRTWEPRSIPEGPFLRRVAFEELFMMSLALHMRRAQWKIESEREKRRVPKIKVNAAKIQAWESALPFHLTKDQKTALREILEDMALTVPMHRLVQGDVGSGKTLVAFFAALAAMESGYQAAMMAPTEILADQHYLNFSKFFPEKAHEVLLLKGALTEKKKKEVREALASGQARFVIGTQALLTDTTLFENLGCVIVDEQHRFGVEQRLGLKQQSDEMLPHLLVMTATPIPRSLALTYYGDLSTSFIREKPAGRSPIQTHVVKMKAHAALEKRLEKFIDEGRQIYIVYPLVEESEELDLKDVQNGYLDWSKNFPQAKVGLLHGRMKSADKDAVMKEFKSGKVQILVSTTVIEVGVDVPNASVIVIEHAERFGLSQLHQLRGRVGRGAQQSYCVLVGPDSPGPLVSERLGVLEKSEDGFEIAEMDLKIRGPGEFMGRRQSGLLGFRVADLVRDADLVELARDEAKQILEKDPRLEKPQNAELLRSLKTWWRGRMELTLSG